MPKSTARPSPRHQIIAWTAGLLIYAAVTVMGATAFTPVLDHFPPSPAMITGEAQLQAGH
jgi:hypothetical protein